MYSIDQGVRGFRLPRHYDVSKGSKISVTPQRLTAVAGAVSLPRWDWQDLAKYSAPALAAVTVAAVLVQSAGDPIRPVTPVAPVQKPVTPAAVVMSADGASPVSDKGQTAQPANAGGTWMNNGWNKSSASLPAGRPTSTVPSVNGATPVTELTGGRGAETTPSVPIVDNVLPIVDPVIPTTPVTGDTDPKTEPQTEESGGLEIVTPIVQVGVDVHPSSLNLGLSPL